MLAYWMMLIWVIFVGNFARNYASKIVRSPDGGISYFTPKMMCWLTVLIPFVFCFLRSGFADTWGYISGFKSLPDIAKYAETYASRKSNQLFYGLETLFKYYIVDDYHCWFFLLAAVQLGCMIKVLSKYSVDISISFFLFIASGMIFSWMFNGLKQFLAATLLFAMTDWLLKKKLIRYCIVALFIAGLRPFFSVLGWGKPPWPLCGFHEPALIIIPIAFCVTGKALNKRLWLLFVFLIGLAATGLLTRFLQLTTENTSYSKDLKYFGANTGMSVARFLVASVPTVLVLLRKRKIVNESTPPIIALAINMSMVSTLIYLLATLTSGIYIGRLPIYCELYNLILYPWLIHHAYKDMKKTIVPIMYVAYIVYFVYQMYFAFGEPYYSDVLTFLN